VDAETRKIRDNCRKLADLLDEAENASGPWMFIPKVAQELHDDLEQKLGKKP
jgi:hypothetical protein